ncbi:uncharacterized protein LOC144389491 [Gasterosteus aculeatus]
MTGLTGLTGATVLLLVSLCALSSTQEEKAALEVNYPQSRVAAAPGSSLRLLCHVTYDVAQCGQLRAAWYQSGSPSDVELTDPSRYVTTVNETEDGARRRRVMTEIVHVTPRDEGRFQCKAECKDGGAVGHFIQVTVGG